MSKEKRLRPFPIYNEQIHTLEHAVQELQDKVQKLKNCVPYLEHNFSLECKRMLQDNYDRYDPRAISSKKDRMDKNLRYDVDKWEKERQEQEAYAWNKVLHAPFGDGSPQAKKYTRHWLNTHYLFKSSKCMDQGATNPYAVVTADDPAPERASITCWKPVEQFETKIETLTQQVSNLKQVVNEWSQKTENLYHDYLNMKTTLNYQKDYYGLPQPPLSNPQAPLSNRQPPL
jgi:hypothetical protein